MSLNYIEKPSQPLSLLIRIIKLFTKVFDNFSQVSLTELAQLVFPQGVTPFLRLQGVNYSFMQITVHSPPPTQPLSQLMHILD